MIDILCKRLTETAKIPTRNHGDAGYDLYADQFNNIFPGCSTRIKTGIAMTIPKGHVGLIWDRSSMGSQQIHRLAGVIDETYRGEIMVLLHNLSTSQCAACTYEVLQGDKIAQILVHKLPDSRMIDVDELPQTSRGMRGFGSTGR